LQEGVEEWCLVDYMAAQEKTFVNNNSDGFISGGKAKELLTASGIDVSALRQVFLLTI